MVSWFPLAYLVFSYSLLAFFHHPQMHAGNQTTTGQLAQTAAVIVNRKLKQRIVNMGPVIFFFLLTRLSNVIGAHSLHSVH